MTPLEQWQAAFQAYLNAGYSSLNANEAVDAAHPGLWQAAVAEVARQVGPGPLSHTASARRPPAGRAAGE